MADKLDVQVTGKSEAEVAYNLFQHVVRVENKDLYPADEASRTADRDYILKTFAACMLAVRRPGRYVP